MNNPQLTTGSTAKHLVRMTLPMFVGISSMIVASMIDIIYIGWLGSLELAAISFTFPLVMGLVTLSMGVGVGAASIIARLAGQGDHRQVRPSALASQQLAAADADVLALPGRVPAERLVEPPSSPAAPGAPHDHASLRLDALAVKAGGISGLATHALLLATLLVAALSALMYAFQAPIFRLLGADEAVLPLIIEYMSIWIIGQPLFTLPMVATMILRAVGHARAPAWVMGGSAILQVGLAPALIFGLPGHWEGLGLAGAAWAFVSSRGMTFLVALKLLLRMRLLNFRTMSVGAIRASWREVLAIGIPSAMNNLISPASLAITVALLAGHSHAVVAGFGVASRMESLATMVLMALSASTGPFVGQNWGAGRYGRIHEAHRLAYRFALGYGVAVCVVLALWGQPLTALIIDDEAVVDATYAYLLIVPVTYGLLGVSMIAGATFTALGKPIPTLLLSLGRMVVIYLPLALAGDHLFGFVGIYGAGALANLLIAIVAAAWLQRHLDRHTPAVRASPISQTQGSAARLVAPQSE